MPPWGTAKATLTASGTIRATFGLDGPKGGMFADMTGTFRADRGVIRTTVLMAAGTEFEALRQDEMSVEKITEDELHLSYRGDPQRRTFVLSRVKPAVPVAPPPRERSGR